MFLVPQSRAAFPALPSLHDWLQEFQGNDAPHTQQRFRWREDDQAVHVEAVLPGYAEDDLELVAEGTTLTIATAAPKDDGAPARPSFRRSIRLPRTVELDRAEAHLERGILTVTVPKAEAAKPRTIRIQGA